MICLDTDVIIDYLKGKQDAVDVIKEYAGEVITTELNVFEVFHGIYLRNYSIEKEKEIADSFFNSLDVLPFDEGCGELGAKITAELVKKGKLIEQNDCLIAAIILKSRFDKIITKNNKHFSRIRGLKVIGY